MADTHKKKQSIDFTLTASILKSRFSDFLKDYELAFHLKDQRIEKRYHGPGCKAVTGYSLEDFSQNPDLFDQLVQASDQKRLTDQILKAARGRPLLPFEFKIQHQSGDTRWIQCVLSKESDSIVRGLWQDVTELKSAEQIMQSSEGKYQSLINDVLEDAHTAMMILDHQFTVVWINRSFESFFNLTRESVIQQNAGRLMLESIQSLMKNPERFSRKVLNTYNNNTYTETFECTLKKQGDSDERWLVHRSQPIRHGLYAGGRVEQYTDITEQKHIIDAIAESEQRFRQLLNHLTDYIYTVKVADGKAGDTFHGPGCFAVTGYSQHDFAREPDLWIQMVNEDDRAKVNQQVQQTLAGQPTAPLEHRILHRGGALRWVKSTIVLRKDVNGRLISYDGLVTDITELKNAEFLAKSQEQQLLQADKMATLGILVAGVAHEINNPNNFILLNSKIIKKAWMDIAEILADYYENQGDFAMAGMPYSQAAHQMEDLIDGLAKGSLRIQKIVQSLKGFARQDTGDLSGQVNINQVVDASIEIVRNLIKKSTHHFKLELAQNLPEITGNFQKLEQVIINLMTNACQALQSADDALTLKTALSSDESHILVQVADTGSGISEEALKHIVDPFFTTKRERGGTGLGLSIAYKIIQDHGGNMYFDSHPGKGTTVEIRLPALSKEDA